MAYAAIEQRPVARSDAATLLWGDTTDKAARLSLRQAIWRLRSELGEALVVTASEISIDRALVSVDVNLISTAVAAGRYREAVALDGGEFLEGADAGATNDFETWVEEVRSRTRTQLVVALQQLVRDAARRGNWQEAARFAERWSEKAPYDVDAALEHARALRASGQANAALARLSAYARTAERDLGTGITPEMQQLIRELRTEAERTRAPVPAEEETEETPNLKLITLWERVAYGRAATAMVFGQAGESSRFTRTFLEWVRARGEAAFVVPAPAQRARPVPFGVLRAVIEGLRTAPGLAGASDDALAVLATWAPGLRDRFPKLPVIESDERAATDALRRVLEAIAEEAAVLIVIEHADVCDEPSATVLADLARNPCSRSLLLLTMESPPVAASPWHNALGDATTIALPRAAPRKRWMAAAVAALLVLVTGTVIVRARAASSPQGPIAIGVVEVIGADDSLGLGRAVPGLLASKLALIPTLQVISSARMHEASLQIEDDTRSIGKVAKRAGARTLIEGEMFKQGTHMRLALRRVRVATGAVEQSYEVSSDNVFALVDEAADLIARSYNVELPRQSISDVTTSSIVAYRFYEEGLRAFYQNDRAVAHRDFLAALSHDSTFAMAAYYASQSAPTADGSLRLFQRAVALSEGAGDRDRLLIQAQWAFRNGSHSLYPIAETLAIRYPHDADGQFYFGIANNSAGRFPEAAQRFQRAFTLDSLSLLGHSVPCRGCEAIENQIGALMAADSMRSAERIARKWIALQPWSYTAWTALGGTLEFQGRLEEADSAYTRAEAVQPDLSDLSGHRFELALRAGRFEAVDSMLALRLAAEKSDDYFSALFHNYMNLRAQGRLREALSAAREMVQLDKDVLSKTGWLGLEARVLVDMGQYARAGALYDSIAQFVISSGAAHDRRHAAGWLANLAGTLVARGDTSRLAELERQVQYYGSMSVGKRERTLYYYVRALRQQMRGDVDGAIESYRMALLSPTIGNVRVSLALGRALTERNRALEAIPILEAAIRGSLGASGTPVPKTELHAALGEAYEAAGQRARARAQYAWVMNAWRRADPEVQVRRARIEQRLRALQVD